MAYMTANDWSGDPHAGNRRVHYRLYVDHTGRPTVICVQDFDYYGYDARRILSPDAWDVEADATQALVALLPLIRVAGDRVAGLEPELRDVAMAAYIRDAVLDTR